MDRKVDRGGKATNSEEKEERTKGKNGRMKIETGSKEERKD